MPPTTTCPVSIGPRPPPRSRTRASRDAKAPTVGQGWPGLQPASCMRRPSQRTSRVAMPATRTLSPFEHVKLSPSQTITGLQVKDAPAANEASSRIRAFEPGSGTPPGH